MILEHALQVPAHVVARKVGGDTVILDLDSGTYFGLDPIGARIWELANEGLTLAEICEVIIGEYDVTRDTIERDLLRLADELAREKLVTVGG